MNLTNRLRLLAAYLRKSSVCPGLPPTGIIATTHRCNMSCRMCIRTTRNFTGPDMEIDLFRKIIDSWVPSLRFLSMDGPGETVINPGAFEMVRYAKSRGVRVMFSTNATLLDDKITAAILDSGLDLIIFSVNGVTPETYKAVHGQDCCREVHANIHSFLKRRQAAKSAIVVAVQMIRLPETLAEVGAFYKTWQQVPGVDIVRVKKDVVCNEGSLPEKSVLKRRNACSRLWHGPMHIEPNGDVYASPGVLFKAGPVGNVKEQSLAELWNGDRMRLMRTAHLSGDLSNLPECVQCGYPRARLPLILGGFLVDPFTAGKYLPLIEKLAFWHRLPLYERHS
jgi:MoaA/NifB/PqqE/SkfB family radical SAM enzyme